MPAKYPTINPWEIYLAIIEFISFKSLIFFKSIRLFLNSSEYLSKIFESSFSEKFGPRYGLSKYLVTFLAIKLFTYVADPIAPPASPGAAGIYIFSYLELLNNLPLATEFIPQPPDIHRFLFLFSS